MSELKIRIAYSGNAVTNGTIDANDFALALMSVSKAIKRATALYDSNLQPKVIFSVQETRLGSVDFTLSVMDAMGIGTTLFVSNDGLEYVLKCIGFIVDKAMISFFDVIRQIAPSSISKVIQDGEGNVNIVSDKGCSITVNKNVYNLYCDQKMKQELIGILNPLNSDGIDRFEVRDAGNNKNKNSLSVIQKKDIDLECLEHSKCLNGDIQVVSDNIRTNVRCECLSVSFDDKKWRFFDGDKNFSASVNDKDFLEKVHGGQKEFRKGSIVIANIREIQKISTNGTISMERSIEKVLDYNPGLQQLPLIE